MAVSDRAIDVHAHLMVPSVATRAASDISHWQEPFTAYASEETTAYNQVHFKEEYERLTVPTERLADMDRMGIGVQAVAIAPPQYYYATDPSLGLDIAQEQNDRIAEACATDSERLLGIATVPLQDVERAVQELRRAVGAHGFRGVEISTNVNGLDLDHPRFEAFWAAVEELGVAVIMHPHGFTHAYRLRDYYLVNTIGNPLDSTVAVHRMIYGGVLERFPRLRICVVHGGGFTPFYSARMDHAFEQRPECRAHISQRPSVYLRRMFVDCLVYDSRHLEHLVESLGSDRVVIGTDYPFDMGYYDPLGQIANAKLAEGDRKRIRVDNAHALLGLSGPPVIP